MIEYVAISLPLISFYFYAIFFSIECGAPLFLMWPNFLGEGYESRELIRAQINPLWEVTNVFLVCALIFFMALFPGAVPIWGAALIVPIFFFLVVMGLRTLGMLYVFYSDGKDGAMSWLLVVTSVLAPAVLAGGVAPFFLTGDVLSWLTIPWGMGAVIVSSLISFSFFRHRTRPTGWSLAAFASTLACLAAILFIVAVRALPVLIYPSVTIYASFTDPLSAEIFLIVFAVGAAIVIPALLFLYHLFLSKQKT